MPDHGSWYPWKALDLLSVIGYINLNFSPKAAPPGRIIKSAETANFRSPRRSHFSENLFNPKLLGILDLDN